MLKTQPLCSFSTSVFLPFVLSMEKKMTPNLLSVFENCLLSMIINWVIIYSSLRYALQIFIQLLSHISNKTNTDEELPTQKNCIDEKQRRKVVGIAENKGENSKIAPVPKHKLQVHKNVEKKLCLEEVLGMVEKVVTLCDEEVEEISDGFSEEEVREAFDVFDENNDGFIDAEELKKVFHGLGFTEAASASEVECKRMIKAFDKNEDGLIDFNEFVKLLEES